MAEVLNVVHVHLGTLVFSRAWPRLDSSNHSLVHTINCSDPDPAGDDSAMVGSADCNGAEARPGTTQIFLDEKQIGKGRIGRVYRGYVQAAEGSRRVYTQADIRVVVKLVIPQGRVRGKRLYPKGHDEPKILADLATEASIYSLMNGIQGEVVPRCYGYYCNDVAGCLVLEDCGEDLKFPYRRLHLQERRSNPSRTLFELQKRVHRVGVSHGDVARRNFAKGPQGIRLLDFDKAVPHECLGFEEPAFEEGFVKETGDACPELRKLFKAFGLLPIEYYLPGEREAYKPWDGEPWWPRGT